MKWNLLATDNSYNWFILRISLGVVMLAHGLQKTFGFFHGFGWQNSMSYFTDHVGLPGLLAAFVILIESLGAFFLIIGFAGRVNATLIGIVMIGAFFTEHRHHGFFMNWFGNQAGEGFEFDILIWAISLVLTVNGSGRWSVDHYLTTGSSRQTSAQLAA